MTCYYHTNKLQGDYCYFYHSGGPDGLLCSVCPVIHISAFLKIWCGCILKINVIIQCLCARWGAGGRFPIGNPVGIIFRWDWTFLRPILGNLGNPVARCSEDVNPPISVISGPAGLEYLIFPFFPLKKEAPEDKCKKKSILILQLKALFWLSTATDGLTKTGENKNATFVGVPFEAVVHFWSVNESACFLFLKDKHVVRKWLH